MKTALVIPAYNEEEALLNTIPRLYHFLDKSQLRESVVVIIAENGSEDRTREVMHNIQQQYPHIQLLSITGRGRGNALRTAWNSVHDVDVVGYMDADLSTGLEVLPKCLEALYTADVAIGSRLHPQAHIQRSWQREILSRGYNALLRWFFRTSIQDAQCGCKFFRKPVIDQLVPQVENNNWFFDTELLLLAEAHDYRITQLPVQWIERKNGRVRVFMTCIENIRGMWRMKRRMKQLVQEEKRFKKNDCIL